VPAPWRPPLRHVLPRQDIDNTYCALSFKGDTELCVPAGIRMERLTPWALGAVTLGAREQRARPQVWRGAAQTLHIRPGAGTPSRRTPDPFRSGRLASRASRDLYVGNQTAVVRRWLEECASGTMAFGLDAGEASRYAVDGRTQTVSCAPMARAPAAAPGYISAIGASCSGCGGTGTSRSDAAIVRQQGFLLYNPFQPWFRHA